MGMDNGAAVYACYLCDLKYRASSYPKLLLSTLDLSFLIEIIPLRTP